MLCPNCGGEVSDGQKICGNCGLPIEAREPAEETIEQEQTDEIDTRKADDEEEVIEPERTEETEEVLQPAKGDGTADEEFEGKDGILPESETDEDIGNRPLRPNEAAIERMIEVLPGTFGIVELGDLPPGTHIEGKLKEADGNIFDYFVVDEVGHEALMNGEEAETLDEAFDGEDYELDVDIGEQAHYHLMIENRSKSDAVDVKVYVRISPP